MESELKDVLTAYDKYGRDIERQVRERLAR